MPYNDVKFNTPSFFKDSFKEGSVLIISGGHSTRKILDRKKEIRKKFDCIITVNYAFSEFDNIIDFHLVTEKIAENNWVFKKLNDGNFRRDVPRIINWKGIEKYDTRYNLYKTSRSYFGGIPNIREYANNGDEGLLIGPSSSQGFALGSVTLSAMHLAGIIGAKNIYIIGADLVFKDQYDHFYNDRVYRDEQNKVKPKNRHQIIEVTLDGNKYKTTKFFKESAEYISKVVKVFFKDVSIFDFSQGLIQNVDKLDIEKF